MESTALARIRLELGSHAERSDGLCAMEAVAWFADEPHSDSPKCASPVAAAFVRRWNDDVGDADRQALLALVPQLARSRGSYIVEQRRGLAAADWLVRNHTVTWLRAGGLRLAADAIAGLGRLEAWNDGARWVQPLGRARDLASAAGGGSPADGWMAGWDPARDAARDASWVAARDSGQVACWLAIWDDARIAARHAAWRASPSSVEDAAGELSASAWNLLESILDIA
jgi:hypothetical protein